MTISQAGVETLQSLFFFYVLELERGSQSVSLHDAPLLCQFDSRV